MNLLFPINDQRVHCAPRLNSDWRAFHSAISRLDRADLKNDEDFFKVSWGEWLKSFNPLPYLWRGLTYFVGYHKLTSIHRMVFNGRQPTQEEVAAKIEELMECNIFFTETKNEWEKTSNQRPDRFYQRLSEKQETALNILRAVVTDQKMGVAGLQKQTMRNIQNIDPSLLFQGFHPEEWKFVEVPFWDELVSIRDTQGANDNRIQTHAVKLQLYLAVHLSIDLSDMRVVSPVIPVLTWGSSYDAVYTVYIQYDKINVNNFNISQSGEGKIPLWVNVNELVSDRRRHVRILGLSKNDFDSSGDRTFQAKMQSRSTPRSRKKRTEKVSRETENVLTENVLNDSINEHPYEARLFKYDYINELNIVYAMQWEPDYYYRGALTCWTEKGNWAMGFLGCRDIVTENVLNDPSKKYFRNRASVINELIIIYATQWESDYNRGFQAEIESERLRPWRRDEEGDWALEFPGCRDIVTENVLNYSRNESPGPDGAQLFKNDFEELSHRFDIKYHMTPCRSDYDSRGDENFSIQEKLQRGGLSYNQPGEGWTRVGFNVKAFGDDTTWLSKGWGGWAVGFHGCRKVGIENVLNVSRRRRLAPGGVQAFKDDADINILSDTRGEKCGEGIYFGEDIDHVAKYYGTKILGYKCVFQARLNPSKVRIPRGKPTYRIVNDPKDVRVYGLCFKRKEDFSDDEQFSDEG